MKCLNRKRLRLGQGKLTIKLRPRGPKPQKREKQEERVETKTIDRELPDSHHSKTEETSSESSVEVITISSFSSGSESSLDQYSSESRMDESSSDLSSIYSVKGDQTESSYSSEDFWPTPRRRKRIDNPYLRRKMEKMMEELGKSTPTGSRKRSKDQ